MDPDSEVEHNLHSFLQQYKSDNVVRFGTDVVPVRTDLADTGVSFKDVVNNPGSSHWARLYLPPSCQDVGKKFKMHLQLPQRRRLRHRVDGESANTHVHHNALAVDTGILVVSLEYCLASEHPLLAAHDDLWEALEWVASHSHVTSERPTIEPWITIHREQPCRCEYGGEVEMFKFEGKGHMFHYPDPECEQARVLHARL
ncbi:hypothetical protein PR202_ga17763 [Eleusine coracana subsp. coracana]|uniref:Alpha/beta hydrolase fold-3 domain-containing protein n=1 Tax=Eleusine coracana subsp. coracana TaxID=191504 RepID=A0AAV5CQL4_ELECO|nr:hypothetical protein PR202_ga17516 [Eleusine coracana subsp. coracana]GJN00571.1 hypothetical protein PR202_ga17763 [Eleusine coracana subsp. coracana]